MRRVLESGEEVFVAIISHLRAGNVEAMTAQVGPATWYVGSGEGAEYGAHAAQVVEAGGLCPSRNAALDDGHRLGLPVVELSDDLRPNRQPVLPQPRQARQAGELHRRGLHRGAALSPAV